MYMIDKTSVAMYVIWAYHDAVIRNNKIINKKYDKLNRIAILLIISIVSLIILFCISNCFISAENGEKRMIEVLWDLCTKIKVR